MAGKIPRDELLTIVADDLQFLQTDWDQEISDSSLRRGSTVLRRLLVDGELQRAWKLAGFEREPRVSAPTLRSLLAVVPERTIRFASVGGAIHRGLIVQGAFELGR